mmetsp:Transcript_12579/g.25635  ORF Transcript_12579/g.25635 Transcript_12579/m.25635 type:complete len:307 (-) Transcript_12579:205-1125(-)
MTRQHAVQSIVSENQEDRDFECLGRVQQAIVALVPDPPVGVDNDSRSSGHFVRLQAFFDVFGQRIHLPPKEVRMDFSRRSVVDHERMDGGRRTIVVVVAVVSVSGNGTADPPSVYRKTRGGIGLHCHRGLVHWCHRQSSRNRDGVVHGIQIDHQGSPSHLASVCHQGFGEGRLSAFGWPNNHDPGALSAFVVAVVVIITAIVVAIVGITVDVIHGVVVVVAVVIAAIAIAVGSHRIVPQGLQLRVSVDKSHVGIRFVAHVRKKLDAPGRNATPLLPVVGGPQIHHTSVPGKESRLDSTVGDRVGLS